MADSSKAGRIKRFPNLMEERIMSFEDYLKIKHPVPYIFELHKGQKALLYLGAQHSADSNHPQFGAFKSDFERFKPELVLLEGGDWPEKYASEQEAIKHAEVAFLSYLARKYDVPSRSCEPQNKEEIKSLSRKFSREHIFAHYALRSITGFFHKEGHTRVGRAIIGFKEDSAWKDFDYSLENLRGIHRGLFKKDIDVNDRDFYVKITNPTLGFSIINEVAAAATKLRDEYVVKLIKRSFKKYNRILIIMGASHAVMQEPALRGYFIS